MRIKKFLALNLAIILLLNAVSFALSRLYWHLSGQTGATLSLRRAAREDKVMYYLVAGNLNQAHEAFRFLEDSLEGGITIVDYEYLRGYNRKHIVQQIINDIRLYQYKPVVIGISMGDMIARDLAAYFPDIESYAICPASDVRFLQPYVRIGLTALMPLAELLTIPLGWLSYLPIVPTGAGNFSLATLFDQWTHIAYQGKRPPSKQTKGVILALQDQFLDINKIPANYPNAVIVYADADHANTALDGKAPAFLKAWKEIQKRLNEKWDPDPGVCWGLSFL